MNCPYCGNNIPNGARFCPKCRRQLPNNVGRTAAPNPRNNIRNNINNRRPVNNPNNRSAVPPRRPVNPRPTTPPPRRTLNPTRNSYSGGVVVNNSSNMMIPILIGVIVAVIIVLCTVLYFALFTVKSVNVSETEKEMNVNDTTSLSATVNPSRALFKNIKWKSSDTNIATVSENGEVKALNNGNVTITAQVGSKTDSCDIEVLIPVEKVTIKKEVTVSLKDDLKVNAKISPDNAGYKAEEWKSSNESVATVDDSGNITAKKVGECNITVTIGGVKSNKCKVTVTNPAKKIKLDKSDLELEIGDSDTIQATVTPKDTTDKIEAKSSDTDVATAKIDDSGKVTITAKGSGSCMVAITAGDQSAECMVTVEDIETEVVETEAAEEDGGNDCVETDEELYSIYEDYNGEEYFAATPSYVSIILNESDGSIDALKDINKKLDFNTDISSIQNPETENVYSDKSSDGKYYIYWLSYEGNILVFWTTMNPDEFADYFA